MNTKSNKFWGIIFLIAPFALLLLTLGSYAIISFAEVLLEEQNSLNDDGITALQLIKIILGFVGTIGVFSMFILVPFGIYFLTKEPTDSPKAFRSLEKITRLTTIFLVVNFVLALICAMYGARYYIVDSPALVLTVSALGLVSWIIFLIWTYRANDNLHSLQKPLKFTPTATVLWLFVPVVNMILWYFIQREIYHYSLPDSSTILVTLWWLFFILLSPILSIFHPSFGYLAVAVAYGLQIAIVNNVWRGQEELRKT